MTKAFSVASWNVEHFGKDEDKEKIEPIVNYLAEQDADIVSIYEVESSLVFEPLMKAMPNYQFHITEGRQVQEVLIGVRHGVSAYITQKLEFKSGQSTLRPGVLVTVKKEGEFYPILFLHLKSSTNPKSLGLRDDMLYRAFKFRGVLDKAAGGEGKSHYLFLGDLNTMGMEYPGGHDIDPLVEINRIKERAASQEMRLLTKNADATWWNGPGSGYAPGNFDHVVAAEHLQFGSFDGVEVDVRGWTKEPTDAEKGAWIKKYSDHALLYFELQQV
jgi:hypothetical protein